jgi:hypothetical protein
MKGILIATSIAVAATGAGSGCFPPCGEPTRAFGLEIEACGLCDATVDLSGGGRVSVVDSFHPGERAVRFVGPVTATFPVYADVGSEYSDGAWIEYVANCPGAPAVNRVRLDDGSLIVELQMPPFAGDDLVDHSQVLSLPPLPDPADPEDPYDPYDDGSPQYLTAVRVIAPAGADCVIDQFTVMYANACPAY